MSRKVTVGQLIEALSGFDPNDEVRIVHQPNWPLQEVIGGIYEPGTGADECEECGYPRSSSDHDSESANFDHEFEGGSDEDGVIYLVADGHPAHPVSPYGSKAAWDSMERVG